MTLLFVALALVVPAGVASAQNYPPADPQWVWQGDVTGSPLILNNPLDRLPTVRDGARRLTLAAPKAPIPKEAVIPFTEGGGPVTLLAPWRGGWLVGTNAGEWGGSLYIALPRRHITLARGNVIGGFTWDRYLYILSGLQHLGLDMGELWEVDLEAPRLVRRIPLPAMPTDVVVTRNKGVIVRTGKGDVALQAGGKVVPIGKH